MAFIIFKEGNKPHADALLRVLRNDPFCDPTTVEYVDGDGTPTGVVEVGGYSAADLADHLAKMQIPEDIPVDPEVFAAAKVLLQDGEISIVSSEQWPVLSGAPTEIAEEGSGDAPPWAFPDPDQV